MIKCNKGKKQQPTKYVAEEQDFLLGGQGKPLRESHIELETQRMSSSQASVEQLEKDILHVQMAAQRREAESPEGWYNWG